MGIDARMIIHTCVGVTDEMVNEWAFRLAECIGSEKFAINRWDLKAGTKWPPPPEKTKYDRMAITRVTDLDCQYEDWMKLKTYPSGDLLWVHVWTRYYGPGYERGDLLTLCGIAEWCEANIEGCVVYYGGDSGGAERMILFDEKKRSEYKAHMFGEEGRKYFEHEQGPKCDLCKHTMNRYGHGPNYASYTCHGCGLKIVSRDGEKTYQVQDPKDIF